MSQVATLIGNEMFVSIPTRNPTVSCGTPLWIIVKPWIFSVSSMFWVGKAILFLEAKPYVVYCFGLLPQKPPWEVATPTVWKGLKIRHSRPAKILQVDWWFRLGKSVCAARFWIIYLRFDSCNKVHGGSQHGSNSYQLWTIDMKANDTCIFFWLCWSLSKLPFHPSPSRFA